MGEADLRKLLQREARHAGAQRADHLYILKLVVHQPQKREREGHLEGVEIARKPLGVGGDTFGEQHRQHRGRRRALGAGEDGDVAVAQAGFLGHEPADAAGNPLGLAAGAADLLQRLVGFAARVGGLIEYVDLGDGRVVRPLKASVEAGEVVVDDFRIAAGHRAGKDGVDKADHRAGGAEVARQGQKAASLAAPVALVAGEEEARLGEAEAVDGLLDVADGEEVIPARNGGDERFLQIGHVLVFVDEHVVILPADAVSHLLAREGAQGAALEVGVGKAAAFLLAAGVGFADAPGGFRQHGGKRRRA